MRVTTETKKATRRRILDSARKLFRNKGFDATTTRDIAARARIAAGTLFNYFPAKEAVAMTLIGEALDQGRADFVARRRGEESLDEDLFLHVMTGLRRLEALRGYVGPVIESTLSPFVRSSRGGATESVRVEHLETVSELLAAHGAADAPSLVAVHLYWTLYLGVLAFWSRDDSPNQEDTLALLDQSMRLFVASLADPRLSLEVPHDA